MADCQMPLYVSACYAAVAFACVPIGPLPAEHNSIRRAIHKSNDRLLCSKRLGILSILPHRAVHLIGERSQQVAGDGAGARFDEGLGGQAGYQFEPFG